MGVIKRRHRSPGAGSVLAAVLCAAAAYGQQAQQQPGDASRLPPAPSAVVQPLRLPGGMLIEREKPGAMPLTLDEAIQIGLKSNTGITLQAQQERSVRGQILSVASALTPSLVAQAYSQTQEINLAAMGFKPSLLSAIHLPGINLTNFPIIVKINTSDAQLNLSQTLFDVPAYFLYRAAQKAGEAANWETLNTRGGVVLAIGGLYLRVLADQAEVRNAAALLRQDQVVFDHAKSSREAGVGISLDVLRAQVALQNEQQQLIVAQNSTAEDEIQLNREMGLPAGQELDLVDNVPFAEFAEMPLEDELKLAFEHRKDLRGLEAQLEVAVKTRRAVRYERVPTLGVGGFYGVLGETTGLYHGVFAAEGKLNVPIFQEAELRGQNEVAQAQVTALEKQITARKASIEADIRSSTLDVQSAAELVKVARSNADLASQALSDATQRFTAGVDDNLPVVQAQATLVAAQSRVVQAEFQYNYAKLTLARNTGVVQTQYNQYLGR